MIKYVFLLFLLSLSVADDVTHVEEDIVSKVHALTVADDVTDINQVEVVVSKDRLLQPRRELRWTPPTPAIPFPFQHVCVSQANTRRQKRQAANSALDTAKNDVGQGAVQGFMQFIVQVSPVNTMCLGNLDFDIFTRKKSSDRNMKNLGCDYLDVPTRGGIVSNVGFSVNYKRKTPGFCAILSEYNNKNTFQMALNKDLTGKIVEKIPKIGKLLSKVSSSKIAFGISEGGYIQKKFTYWKGYNRSKTLAAHAMLKMNIVLDAVKLVERFFKKYKTRKGKLPSKFVSIIGDVESYVRFNGNIKHAIDCVFGARSCSTSQLTTYLFDKEIYISGEGKVEIDLSKIVGLLPKITIDLNSAQVYKTMTGFYFTWKMPNILSVIGELINHTIGKIPGMPRVRAQRVEFHAYFDETGFGFSGEYLGFTLECTVDFNKKDPIHCKFGHKYFAVMMEALEDIGNAAKAIFMETKDMIEATGKIVDKGAQAAVEVGGRIIKGAAKGVIDAADHLSGELDAFVGGTRDWCDCNKRGYLIVWGGHGTEEYWLHARNNYQMINWGKKVREVWWRCSDGGGTQRAYFGNGGSTWMVKYTHERKHCRKSGDWWPRHHSSGRIYWK